MRIYLAGKIDPQYGAWRDAILPSRFDESRRRHVPAWVLLRDPDDVVQWGDGDRFSSPWPRSANKHVLGLHEYVGPYRTDMASDNWEWKQYGEFHGSKVFGQHGSSNGDEDGLIVEECRQAIARSDLFFAYINRPDCFGTLVELGIAKALGVFTVVAIENGAAWDWSDYWFAVELAGSCVRVPDPVEIGPEPVCPEAERYQMRHVEARLAWEDRKDAEQERIRGLIREAILLWTARPEKPSPVALVKSDEAEPHIRALQEAANSLAQIARWSADPRVRNEAQRMLRRIAG